jgi:putative nucleotidyltransferase with HDIG domain
MRGRNGYRAIRGLHLLRREIRIGDSGLLDKPTRRPLAGRIAVIFALIAAVSAAHYWTPRGDHWLHVTHMSLGKLYVLPVVLAAIWFGLRGALLSAVAVTCLYVPHILVQWASMPDIGIDQWSELATAWVTAVLAGVFADRERTSARRLAVAYEGMVRALVAALDAREHDTEEHSLRVRAYTLRLAAELGISPEQQRIFALGALLHDIGKIGVPDAILLKPGRLNPREREQMRQHPELGRQIVKSVPFFGPAADLVQAHHERWDGRGYPDGLRGEEIPLGARVFAVADAYDALTTRRPYRDAGSDAQARTTIRAGAGTQFDPAVVAALERIPAPEWAAMPRAAVAQNLTGSPTETLGLSSARTGRRLFVSHVARRPDPT